MDTFLFSPHNHPQNTQDGAFVLVLLHPDNPALMSCANADVKIRGDN